MAGYVPPWSYEFREGVACAFCGNAERVVLCGSGISLGVCESCSVIVHYVWRGLSEAVDPVKETKKPLLIKVLVPRLLKRADGTPAMPSHPATYEYLFDLRGDGNMADLPTATLKDPIDAKEAVGRVLADLGLVTWDSCVEPLYRAHTYRGGMAEVYLVTAYGEVPGVPRSAAATWRNWPVWNHVGASQVGFYSALEHVWPLRLLRRMNARSSTLEVVTFMRRGAVEYVALQLALLKDPSTDTSMAEYLHKSMSDDEKLVCKTIVEDAKLEAETVVEEPLTEGVLEKVGEDDLPEEVGDAEPDSLEDAFGGVGE
jgi:hypothetical protein